LIDGGYEPVGPVVSINAGRELAEPGMRCRVKYLERGGAPGYPECYLVWAQGIGADYRVAEKLMP
jgi:hypothetical protein